MTCAEDHNANNITLLPSERWTPYAVARENQSDKTSRDADSEHLMSCSPTSPFLVEEFDFIDEGSFKSRETISILIDIYLDSIYPL